MNSLAIIVSLLFTAGANWLPLPSYEDRQGWQELMGQEQSERFIKAGERYLDYEWKAIPATAYLEFERTGDRSAMESRQGANRGAMITLMLAELAEGKGRFTDQLMNGAWLAAEQTSWVLSAHQSRQASGRALPDAREQLIDLGSARYGSIIALTYHFFHSLFDEIDSSVSVAIEAAIKRNILDPFLDEQENAANWWLGFTRTKESDIVNNWNPWCNAEVALCFLLMEKDQARLDAAMDKSIRSIAEFTSYIKQDGACEEGPSYWGAACGKLYDWMQVLYDASEGGYDRFQDPLFVKMVEYVSRSYIGDGYVVNFADAAARGVNPPELMWRCGNACGSKEVCDFALLCLGDNAKGRFRYPSVPTNDSMRALMSVYYNKYIREAVDSLNVLIDNGARYEDVCAGLRSDVPAATWYPETEFAFIRGQQGWFFAGKGGHNNESHNHNDIGSCILFIRNIPVLCDAGVGTYTKQTFGAGRYDIWTMQSDWHSLPMINGSSQVYGREFKARNISCDLASGTLSMDISGAYMEAAACKEWKRSCTLAQGSRPSLTISDSFVLKSRVCPDVENFLVKGEVLLPGQRIDGRTLKPGELVIDCGDGLRVRMSYPTSLSPSVEEKAIEDPKLSKVWGPVLRRISLTSKKNAATKGRYVFTFTEF